MKLGGGGHLATNDCVNFPNWHPSFLEIFQPMPKNAKVILDVLKSNNRLEEAFVKTHQLFIPKMRPTFKRIIIWKWVEESEAEKIASLPGLSFILHMIWFFV